MSDLSMSPCVHVLQVLESSADTCSQNILALCWSNAKEKKSSSSSFLHQRCWVPCCLFLTCSTIFWGHAVLPSKYTEHSPEDPHGPLLAAVKAGWKKKIVTEAVFHWKGMFQGKMFLGNMWRWVNLWLKNVRLLQQQEKLALFQVFQFVHSQLVFVQLTFIFGQKVPCVLILSIPYLHCYI